jgi:molybdenum-dependent DNA-binding transcriptional regulator ModE
METNQGLFWGYVQNGKIFNQVNQQVGVLMEEYQKAIDTAKKFEEVLYEHNILTRPKTPEEINTELQNTIQTLVSTVSSLNEKINKLEQRENKNVDKQKSTNELCQPVSGSRKESNAKSGV